MDAPMKQSVRSSRAKPKVLLIIIVVAALIAVGLVFIKKSVTSPATTVESEHKAVIDQIGNNSVQGSITDKQKTDILKTLEKKTPAPNMTDRAAILDSIGKASNQ